MTVDRKASNEAIKSDSSSQEQKLDIEVRLLTRIESYLTTIESISQQKAVSILLDISKIIRDTNNSLITKEDDAGESFYREYFHSFTLNVEGKKIQFYIGRMVGDKRKGSKVLGYMLFPGDSDQDSKNLYLETVKVSQSMVKNGN